MSSPTLNAIFSRAPTEKYRENYDRIFSNKQPDHKAISDLPARRDGSIDFDDTSISRDR